MFAADFVVEICGSKLTVVCALVIGSDHLPLPNPVCCAFKSSIYYRRMQLESAAWLLMYMQLAPGWWMRRKLDSWIPVVEQKRFHLRQPRNFIGSKSPIHKGAALSDGL